MTGQPLSTSPSSSPDASRGSWFTDEASVLGVARRARAGVKAPHVPGYEELHEIKRGGQGVVYAGVQRSTRQRVAVKVLLGGAYAGGQQLRRFEREAELAASLRHPSIVRVYDSGVTADGLAFLVMEYVEGRPLDEVLRESPPPVTQSREDIAERRRRVGLFSQVCGAISHAHQRGVIHRDIKPSNIRIEPGGQPRVLDFGLAKSQGPESIEVSTSGQFLGSLPWASPEQATGNPDTVDVRSDVYSLGVLLYQMLTGKFPYDISGSLATTLDNIRGKEPVPPRSVVPGLDDDLQTILLKCLAKDLSRRYQAVADLESDVLAWLAGEPIRARRDSAWYTLRRRARRHRAAAIFTGTALVLALGGAAWLSVLYGRAASAEESAASSLSDARRELQEKSLTLDFLKTMLASANPSADGRQVKVVDILESAKRRLASPTLPDASRAMLGATVAETYTALGQYQEAEPLLLAALALRERLHGPDHAQTLILKSRLSYLRYRQGRLEEAETTAREAVHSAETLPVEERALIGAFHSLGLALHGRGKLSEAEAQFRRSVADVHEAGLEETRDGLDSIVTLAICLRQQEKLEESGAIYEREIARMRAAGTIDTVEGLNLQGNYASLLQSKGDEAQAESLYRHVAAGQAVALGEGHDDTLATLSNLSTLLIASSRLEEAERILRDCVRLCTASLGEGNHSTLTYTHNLGKVLQDRGNLSEAESVMRRTLELRLKVLGEEHPHTLATMSNLGGLFKAQGKSAQSLAMDRHTLSVRRRVYGDTNTNTLISLNNVGMGALAAGETAEALELIGKAVAGAEGTLGPSHWMTATFRASLAKAHDKAGATPEAERLFMEAYNGMAASVKPGDKRLTSLARSVSEFFARAGRPEDAAAWLARAEHPSP